MKLRFNDATEITVQQVKTQGDYLNILTVGNTPEQLRVLFEDTGRTAKMTVQERGQTIAEYEGYTAFYRTEIYTGKIYGVTMYRPERLPEVQAEMQQAAVLVAHQNRPLVLTEEHWILYQRIHLARTMRFLLPIRMDAYHLQIHTKDRSLCWLFPIMRPPCLMKVY